MPELPEVEIVCRNLSEMLGSEARLKNWDFYRSDLRTVIPQESLQKLRGLLVRRVYRRAKFILFDLGDFTIVSHLGMTGAWREVGQGWSREKHDHLSFTTSKNQIFVYSDPRRFGFIEVWSTAQLAERFVDYGLEPLDRGTNFTALTRQFKQLQKPVKLALMDQKYLVGVGNIYASEILFVSGVSPLKKCSKITEASYALIWKNTQKILQKAIERGGSSIENYRNSYGEKGDFQKEHMVYGRTKEPCLFCHTPVKQKVMGGRSTFWCPRCQK